MKHGNEGLEPESAEGRKLDESEEEEVKVAKGGQELSDPGKRGRV